MRNLSVLFCGIFFGMLAIPQSSAQTGPAIYSYLGKATESIMIARLKGPEIEIEEFANAIATACEALNLLLMESDLEKALDAHQYADNEAQAVLRDLDQFSKFLIFEREVLIQMEISDALATNLVSELATFRKIAQSAKWTPKEIMEKLQQLRDLTCETRDQARNIIDSSKRWAIVIRIGQGVFGIAVAAGNTVSTAPTLGFSDLSIPFGLAIFAQAF